MAAAVPEAARDVARPRHSPATKGVSEKICANSVWKVKLAHCKKCPKCGKNKRGRTWRPSSESESSGSSLSVASKDSGKHDRSKFKGERSAVDGTNIQIRSGDVERATKTLESWQADLTPRPSSRKAAPRGSAKVCAAKKSKKSQSLGNLTGRESFPMRPLPPKLGAGNLATACRASAAIEFPFFRPEKDAANGLQNGVPANQNQVKDPYRFTTAVISKGVSPSGPDGCQILSPNLNPERNSHLAPIAKNAEEITPNTK
ncbi:unnamed protein product [Ixodes persulcatus]